MGIDGEILSQDFVDTCLRHVSIVGVYGLLTMVSGEMDGEKLELCGQSSALERGLRNLMFLTVVVTGFAMTGSVWIVECLG